MPAVFAVIFVTCPPSLPPEVPVDDGSVDILPVDAIADAATDLPLIIEFTWVNNLNK